MPRFALTLEYHGGPFIGWQRQSASQGQSVQGAVEAALRRLEPDAPGIAAAGRTDAGVHATGQVAHCDLARDWAPFRLSEALNHHLKPLPVAVVSAERVPENFHARFSAVYRTYSYRVRMRRAPLVHEAGLVWRVPHDLDADAMREAATCLIGRHDFTTFRSVHCQSKSPVKTLDRLDVIAKDGLVRFELGAISFLHNQVRSLVGTLERVGAGRWSAARVAEALAAQDRAACGPVAPPDGLYLTGVHYPDAATRPDDD